MKDTRHRDEIEVTTPPDKNRRERLENLGVQLGTFRQVIINKELQHMHHMDENNFSTSDSTALTHGNTQFAFDLYQQLRSTSGNLFSSPFSISSVLAMALAGARETTERQMQRILHLPLKQERLHPAVADLGRQVRANEEEEGIVLKIANSLWPHQGCALREAFLDLTRRYYGASIIPIDYGDPTTASATINRWVEDHTEGKIKGLISSKHLDSSTRLILVNVVCFLGSWASRFPEEETQAAPFWVTPQEEVSVSMMAQTEAFGYRAEQDLQILDLPYAGKRLSMLLLLPREADGLARLEESLSLPNLERWSQLRSLRVSVFLPRFKFRLSFDLSVPLKSMGMTDPFSAGANFSGMDPKPLFVSKVLHQAWVDVSEQGTAAAAATAVMMSRGMPSAPPVFRADHPFLFLIRDNSTGSVLFMGRVANPVAEG